MGANFELGVFLLGDSSECAVYTTDTIQKSIMNFFIIHFPISVSFVSTDNFKPYIRLRILSIDRSLGGE